MVNRSPVNILYVDDEMNNLLSFKALFRLKYNVHLALNVAEAIGILEKNKIHLLLTDQRMPGITGLEFVQMIEGKYDNPVCALITGCAGGNEISNAIKSGKIYTYLSKPWDEQKLEHLVQEAYNRYNNRNLINEKALLSSLLLSGQHIKNPTSLRVY